MIKFVFYQCGVEFGLGGRWVGWREGTDGSRTRTKNVLLHITLNTITHIIKETILLHITLNTITHNIKETVLLHATVNTRQ